MMEKYRKKVIKSILLSLIICNLIYTAEQYPARAWSTSDMRSGFSIMYEADSLFNKQLNLLKDAIKKDDLNEIEVLLLKYPSCFRKNLNYLVGVINKLEISKAEKISRLLLNIDKEPMKDNVLNIAAELGYRKAVKLLIELGADVNVTSGLGNNTSLMKAVSIFISKNKQDYLLIVEDLIKGGALLNLTNILGETALMIAAEKNQPEMVYLLLLQGADTTIVNNQGKTFYDYARDKPEIQKILKDYRANVQNKIENEADYPEDMAELILEYTVTHFEYPKQENQEEYE